MVERAKAKLGIWLNCGRRTFQFAGALLPEILSDSAMFLKIM